MENAQFAYNTHESDRGNPRGPHRPSMWGPDPMVVYTPVWETPVIAWIYLSLCGTKVSLCLNSFQVELAEFIIEKHAFPSALAKNFLWPGFVETGSSFSLYGPLGSISPQEGSETGRLACLAAHHYLWHPMCQQGLPWWGLPRRVRDPIGQKTLAWW